MFEDGLRLVRGAGIVTIVLFFAYWIGTTRFGKIPTSGAAGGRALAVKHLRWVGLAAVCVGLIMMAIASF
jgi:hypothetical protein